MMAYTAILAKKVLTCLFRYVRIGKMKSHNK